MAQEVEFCRQTAASSSARPHGFPLLPPCQPLLGDTVHAPRRISVWPANFTTTGRGGGRRRRLRRGFRGGGRDKPPNWSSFTPALSDVGLGIGNDNIRGSSVKLCPGKRDNWPLGNSPPHPSTSIPCLRHSRYCRHPSVGLSFFFFFFYLFVTFDAETH